MKSLYLLLIPLLIMHQAGAQTRSDRYTVLSMGYGTWFPKYSGRNISVSFPYTVNDLTTGNATRQTFTGATQGEMPSQLSALTLLDLELVRKDHSFDVSFGINSDMSHSIDFGLKGGYRLIFPLGPVLIKPGIDVYLLMGSGVKLGTIDNRQSEIFAFGHTAPDQWTKYDADNDITNTYDADHLDVRYRRDFVLASPKLILSTRPIGKFTFSVEAGWMLQLKQFSILKLEQWDNGHNWNVVAQVPLENNGSMDGPYIGMNVGICL